MDEVVLDFVSGSSLEADAVHLLMECLNIPSSQVAIAPEETAANQESANGTHLSQGMELIARFSEDNAVSSEEKLDALLVEISEMSLDPFGTPPYMDINGQPRLVAL
jgi:hypothetical protein